LDGPENKNLRKRVWVRGQNNLHSIFLTQLPANVLTAQLNWVGIFNGVLNAAQLRSIIGTLHRQLNQLESIRLLPRIE
jgi:hypothetical protein